MKVWVEQVVLAEPPMRVPPVNLDDEMARTFAAHSQCFEEAVSITHSATLLSCAGVAASAVVLEMKIYSCWPNSVPRSLVSRL